MPYSSQSPIRYLSALCLFAALGAALGPAPCARAQNWVAQFGSSAAEFIEWVTPDGAGGVFAAQRRWDGEDYVIYVSRLDEAGQMLWTQMMTGRHGSTYVLGMIPDGVGGAYLGLNDYGTLHKASVNRFDAQGNTLWQRFPSGQFSSGLSCIFADGAGGVMVRASPGLLHFDSEGTLLTTRVPPSPSYFMAFDGAGGFLTSSSYSAFGDPVRIARTDGNLDVLWERAFDSPGEDTAKDICPDGTGGIIVVGNTDDDLFGPNAGGQDSFIVRYDADGNQLWAHQMGGEYTDSAVAVSPNGSGGFIVAGTTASPLGGPKVGGYDGYLLHFGAQGNRIGSAQFGSGLADEVFAMSSDGNGGWFAGGATGGSWGGPYQGYNDAFVAHFVSMPCDTDCDTSTGSGVLDIFDFLCFQNSFVGGETYACDCDTSTGVGVCDVFDFLCFQDAFVAGCP